MQEKSHEFFPALLTQISPALLWELFGHWVIYYKKAEWKSPARRKNNNNTTTTANNVSLINCSSEEEMGEGKGL